MKLLSSLLIVLLLSVGCSHFKTEPPTPSLNSELARKAPYVLMISIDGYRHDYTDKYQPPFLSNFKKRGLVAKSLIPAFPTKTFPNHYTLVTGLYPGHHGIVDNHFYAPDLKLTYKLSDRAAVVNKDFYRGNPLWNLSQEQGMLSATYFWPGSEADIGAHRPTYWEVYDHDAPHSDRIDQIIEWLKLPSPLRPHFLTLYFHDVDSAGHRYGPDSEEVREAILKVDKSLEILNERLKEVGLPINILIVSDHGMTATARERALLLNPFFETPEASEVLRSFKRVGSGPLIHFYYEGKEEERRERVKELLEIFKTQTPKLGAYTPESSPRRWNIAGEGRMGDVFVVAPMGVFIGFKGDRLLAGNHGYDNIEGRDMHGIFYAKGPGLRRGKIGSFSSVDVYPLVAELLKLEVTTKIDGDLSTFKHKIRTKRVVDYQ